MRVRIMLVRFDDCENTVETNVSRAEYMALKEIETRVFDESIGSSRPYLLVEADAVTTDGG